MKGFKRFLAEAIGTFVVLSLSLGLFCTIRVSDMTALTPTLQNGIFVATFAISYAGISSALAKFSGGRFNPVFSVGLWFTSFFKRGEKKLLKFSHFVLDLAGQVVGVLLASAFLFSMFGYVNLFSLTDIPGLAISNLPYLVTTITIQCVLVAILVFVIAALNDQKNNNTGLIAGLTLGAVMMVAIPLTGGCLNPFRYLAGAALNFLFGDASWFLPELLLVNIAAPLFGAIVGGLLYGLLSIEKNHVEEEIPETYKKVYAEYLKAAEEPAKATSVQTVVVKPVTKEEKMVETKVVEQPKSVLVTEPVVNAQTNELPIQIERKSFEDKLKEADKDILAKYKTIRNEILSYDDIKSRVSFEGETFRSHRNALVFIALRGKGIKVCFRLDPKQFKDSPIPVDDQSSKRKYANFPAVLKVKSDLSLKRALVLVQQTMETAGIQKL